MADLSLDQLPSLNKDDKHLDLKDLPGYTPPATWSGAAKGDLDAAVTLGRNAVGSFVGAVGRSAARIANIPTPHFNPFGFKEPTKEQKEAASHQGPDLANKLQELISSKPQTAEGKYLLERIGSVVGPIANSIHNVQHKVFGAATPAVEDVETIGLSMLPAKGIAGSKLATAETTAQAAAQAEGFAVNVAKARPTILNRVLTLAGGKNTQAWPKNTKVAENLAKRSVGIDKDAPLDTEHLDEARRQAGQSYEAVKDPKWGDVQPSGGFHNEIDESLKDARAQTTAFQKGSDATRKVIEVGEDLKAAPKFSTAVAVEKLKELRAQARAAFSAGDSLAGRAYRGMERALDKELTRHVVDMQTPKGLELTEIRKALKDAGVKFQSMVSKDKDGNFKFTSIGGERAAQILQERFGDKIRIVDKSESTLKVKAVKPPAPPNAAKVIKDYKDARAIIARTHQIEDSFTKGVFDPSKLIDQIGRLHPDLDVSAKFARDNPEMIRPAHAEPGHGDLGLAVLAAGIHHAASHVGRMAGHAVAGKAILPYAAYKYSKPWINRMLNSRAYQATLGKANAGPQTGGVLNAAALADDAAAASSGVKKQE